MPCFFQHRYVYFVLACLWGCGLLPGAAHAVLETPAVDVFHAESDLVRNAGVNLRPNECPALPSEGQAIAMMQTINIVLCNNRNTRASWFQLRSQAISLNQTKVDEYIPSITSDASLSRTNTSSDGTTTVSTSTGVDVSLGYTLFDFGVREANIEAAEKSMQAAMLNYDSSLQGVIANTIRSYYDVLSAEYSLQAAEQNLAFSGESFNAARARYEIGLVALSDVLQAQTSYSQSKLSVERAQNALKLAQNDLLILMGYTPDHTIVLEDVDDSKLVSNALDLQVQDLVEKAKMNRKDLAAAVKSLEASKASLDASRRGNLPKINLSASQSYDADNIFENTQRTGRLGFSVSVPIFSGLTRAYSLKSSEESIKAQELSLEQTEMDIVQDVWTAYTNYKSAEQSWVTSFDAMTSATELRDIALGRYKAGVGDLLDVLSAQNSYTSALNSQIDTRFNLLISRINLVRAVGVLDLTNADPKTSMIGLK